MKLKWKILIEEIENSIYLLLVLVGMGLFINGVVKEHHYFWNIMGIVICSMLTLIWTVSLVYPLIKGFGVEFNVMVEKTGTGYSAYLEEMNGVISTGKDLEEVVHNMNEAITLHIEGVKKDDKWAKFCDWEDISITYTIEE